MPAGIFVLWLFVGAWQMKQVAAVPFGVGIFVGGDTDHDGREEILLCGQAERNGSWEPCYQIWENSGWNRYVLVHSDTGAQWWVPGLHSGNFVPSDIGDPDDDGLVDILGYNEEYGWDSTGQHGLRYPMILTMESPSGDSCPTRMSWGLRYNSQGATGLDPRAIAPDLDRDGRQEIVCFDEGLRVLECVGNSAYESVWFSDTIPLGYGWPFSDFDLDGRRDFVGSGRGATVVENSGPDSYSWVWADTIPYPNLHDVFAGRDVNQNGRPEFFVRSAQYRGMAGWHFDLLMFEATGDNAFVMTHVAEVSQSISDPGTRSACGDIDGDGVDEVAWDVVGEVIVFHSPAPSRLEGVCSWYTGAQFGTAVKVLDMNHNGYADIVVSNNGRTVVVELEAIRVLRPNRRAAYQPGDTCRVSWQTFDPPRCDSVSLFLRTDTTYQLDTIAHGLAPTDTPYVWIVPDIRADSARVMAIAYGPGWQYDESDSAIRILGSGISEARPQRVRELRLAVSPNPARGAVSVSYDLPSSVPVDLSVINPAGRKVATLASGRIGPGRHQVHWNRQDNKGRALPAGVYFVRLAAGEKTRLVKLVLTGEER